MLSQPIIEIDVHGLSSEEAFNKIDALIKKADNSVYTIRVIHGFNRGHKIRDSIYREFGYGLCDKVLKIRPGANAGITELVLRNY